MKLAVCVLVRRADGRLLFIERAKEKFAGGYWTPVTGSVEAGETPEAAARREVHEETGLEVAIGPELGRTKVDAPPGETAPPFVLVWFEARLEGSGERLALQASEVASAKWVTVAEALALEPMFETTRRFVRERSSSS